MPTQTEREDLGTNARQTAISTLITEGEPAVKAATDLSLVFFSVPKHSRLKEKYTTEQNRRAHDVFFSPSRAECTRGTAHDISSFVGLNARREQFDL